MLVVITLRAPGVFIRRSVLRVERFGTNLCFFRGQGWGMKEPHSMLILPTRKRLISRQSLVLLLVRHAALFIVSIRLIRCRAEEDLIVKLEVNIK